jgi:hypothetical protein
MQEHAAMAKSLRWSVNRNLTNDAYTTGAAIKTDDSDNNVAEDQQ